MKDSHGPIWVVLALVIIWLVFKDKLMALSDADAAQLGLTVAGIFIGVCTAIIMAVALFTPHKPKV